MSLYHKYRPKSFKEVVGQPEAVRILQTKLKGDFPHAVLFTGPSGCGKTTLARILREKLNCSDSDFSEINAADTRGIEDIRNIATRMRLSPMSKDGCRVWIIDECHQLTSDAQSALLKMLEDTPSHVYFMLATTDPQKLKQTIKTRCTEIKVRPLSPTELQELTKRVCENEGLSLADEVVDKVCNFAEGSARKALVLLDAIVEIKDTEEQLDALEKSEAKSESIELCRVLFNPKAGWKDVAQLLSKLEAEPEQLRHAVLGYASAILLKSGGKMLERAAHVIKVFQYNFYDSKKPGLILACYEVMEG